MNKNDKILILIGVIVITGILAPYPGTLFGAFVITLALTDYLE